MRWLRTIGLMMAAAFLFLGGGPSCVVGFFVFSCDSDFDCSPDEFCNFDGNCAAVSFMDAQEDCPEGQDCDIQAEPDEANKTPDVFEGERTHNENEEDEIVQPSDSPSDQLPDYPQ